MPRAYSLDLRERVVGLVASGEPCRAVAELFDVSVASVVKWSQRARATGSAAAKPMGGKRPYLLEGERDWLLARLAEKPDLTLHALLAELGERDVVVSCDTLWRFLKRLGISFKKKPCSRPSRIALTSPAAAPGGSGTNLKSILLGSSSSMRRGQRPTWPVPMAGGDVGSRSGLRSRTAIGAR